MFSISFPDGLFLLEVEAYDGFVRLFYGLLLLDTGGITVSAAGSHAVDARPRRLRESMTMLRAASKKHPAASLNGRMK